MHVCILARARDGAFAIPAAAASCPDYDDWHYGLQNRNTFANAVVTSLVKQNLVNRQMTVMVGTADTLTADLDVSCGANLQGARRFQRGRTMIEYMNARHPGHAHRLVEVPGVGHAPTLGEPVAMAAIDRFLEELSGRE